ncbi:general transcription factor II-I repeat domain-containing protein 2A-like [Hydra vulgaris]|uniref:General transcription factor II-I repeat domain-containing protein 2A-like n=1 Tax=Hydra vulgaris TaxID=6087 RepID=A0ABM4D021_HYDVU
MESLNYFENLSEELKERVNFFEKNVIDVFEGGGYNDEIRSVYYDLLRTKLECHFVSKHELYNIKYPHDSTTRKIKYDSLKSCLEKQKNLFQQTSSSVDCETHASNMMSWILAKNLKPFTDGEIIKECMIEASKFLFPNDKNIHDKFQKAEFVSIALDESTDLVGKAQLCVYARFITTNYCLFEELLGIEPLETTTTGQGIYDKLFKILKNTKVPLQKISSVVTDGAPAMIERIRGVVTLLRNSGEFPNKFMSYHCVTHQEALCAKVATIDDVMTAVVKTINHIRSNALKRRQFRALMEQNEDEHGDLLLHSEVRWLSRGNILNRFWECLPSVLLFMLTQKFSFITMSIEEFKCKLAFLCDITAQFNVLNKRLQGHRVLVCDLINHITVMKTKLNLYKTQFASGSCTHFPTLNECQPSREMLSSFSLIVTALYDQFENRFNEFEDLKKHKVLLCYPFDFDMKDISILKDFEEADILKAEDELINFQCDDELRRKAPKKDEDGTFGENLIIFWHAVMKERFPVLKKHANRLICMYGTMPYANKHSQP